MTSDVVQGPACLPRGRIPRRGSAAPSGGAAGGWRVARPRPAEARAAGRVGAQARQFVVVAELFGRDHLVELRREGMIFRPARLIGAARVRPRRFPRRLVVAELAVVERIWWRPARSPSRSPTFRRWKPAPGRRSSPARRRYQASLRRRTGRSRRPDSRRSRRHRRPHRARRRDRVPTANHARDRRTLPGPR